jgi:hypothetical protein
MVHRDDLGRRVQDLLPLLLAASESQGAVRVTEYVALIEHLVDLLLHPTELVEALLGSSRILLHLLEEAHFRGDLRLFLGILELLRLDLHPGLAAQGGGLHEVARPPLGD